MKISQKHVQYLLLLLIVLIAGGAYYFGYLGFIEKAESIKKSNIAVEARINELTEKEKNREEWNAGIARVDGDIKDVLAKYGPGNTPEKSIMFVRSLEEAADMRISNVSFNPDSSIFVSSDYDENGNPKVEMDTTFISINYATTYDGLKACMKYINEYKERMNVSGFTASPNPETGEIGGNMVINLFSVKDADHVYEAPAVSGISLGTDNIFGSGFGTISSDTGADDENVAETGENGETGEAEENSETTEGESSGTND